MRIVQDVLVISRGGGDNLEIFENPAIAEVSLSLRCIFLTAIGHKENIPLLKK
jgi:exonuclease VII large subunit